MNKTIVLLAIFMLSNIPIVTADMIELHSGKIFEGEIISYQNKQIVLQTEEGDLKVKIRMIKNIDISKDTNKEQDWLEEIDEDLDDLNIRRKERDEDHQFSQQTEPVVYKNNLDFQVTKKPQQRKINPSAPQTKKIQNKKVEVYMRPGCGYCEKMMAFLNKNGIRFTSYNIETNQSAQRRFNTFRASGVPVVVINGKTIIRGCDERAVLQAL